MPDIIGLKAAAYRIPTESPESDGTLAWDSTTLVVVHVEAGGRRGTGFGYSHEAAATLIRDKLAGQITGVDAMDVPTAMAGMLRAVRNYGRQGLCAQAISAVDCALWDLKARLLGVPLFRLLGAARDGVPVYGSGGFTSYDRRQLQRQLADWAQAGMRAVKMKVGRDPDQDRARVGAAREAVGPETHLFVDANGAYGRKQALAFAERFAEDGVAWFEEPVSSDDLDGLRLLRSRAPAGMEISAGEYAWDTFTFRQMLMSEAVDVMQADATRCLGVSGFLAADALCRAFSIPLSSHTAPSLHLPMCMASEAVRHMEWFHDHVRIERMLFDGAPQPENGVLRPDPTRPGFGLEFKAADAEPYAV